MLTLTRKPLEEIVCGAILIKVLEINGNRVRLVFDGPREVDIYLAEKAAQRTAPRLHRLVDYMPRKKTA